MEPEEVERYKMAFYNVHMHILNISETRKQQRFLTIQGTITLLQRLCMTFVPIVACQHQPLLRQACGKRRRLKK